MGRWRIGTLSWSGHPILAVGLTEDRVREGTEGWRVWAGYGVYTSEE